MFKVDDVIYVAKFNTRKFNVDCPVCFKKGTVGLILGNGDIVTMPCEFCNRGCGTSPTGYVSDYRLEAGTEAIVVNEVKIEVTNQGQKIEYVSGYSLYQADVVFKTAEEAMKYAVLKVAEQNKELETKAEHIKGKPSKNYSWNAGYHIREAKNHEKKIEWHKKMAVICKAKAGDTDE
jgi:hypothetical protein